MKNVGRCPNRSLRSYFGIALRGVCMGAADVVPGVSGGTVALITGIYEELILSIRSFDARAARLLIGFRIKALLNRVRWPFLFALLMGILAAIFSLSRAIAYLLDNAPVFLWSFFFGLVLASVYTVGKRIPQWDLRTLLGTVGATLGAYFLVGLVPVEMPHSPPYIFGSAVIAICAMILPGISGSFVLVLLGQYPYLLNAVNTRDLFTIAIFGAGAVVGLMAFARVLSWFLQRYHNLTIALLTGLMLGSLRKIWPWKKTLETMVNPRGKAVPLVQVNELPAVWSGEVFGALSLALFGLMLVLILGRLGRGK